MELRQDRHLLQSLILTADTITSPEENSSSPNAAIISRIAMILLVGIFSIWANHEANKGFVITIINDAGDTAAGKRFTLFYQSNDKATRIVLSTSTFVEKILYSTPTDSDQEIRRKKVNHVKLCFGCRNLTANVPLEVDFTTKNNEFTLHLNPSLLTEPRRRSRDYDYAVYSAVQRGMARVWLGNGNGNAAAVIVDAMVESISGLAGYGGEEIKGLSSTDCLGSTAALGRFMSLCEREKSGFIRRLNERMIDYWDDGMVEDALGMPVRNLCPFFNSSSWRFTGTIESQ